MAPIALFAAALLALAQPTAIHYMVEAGGDIYYAVYYPHNSTVYLGGAPVSYNSTLPLPGSNISLPLCLDLSRSNLTGVGVDRVKLSIGDRIVTVNTYHVLLLGGGYAADLYYSVDTGILVQAIVSGDKYSADVVTANASLVESIGVGEAGSCMVYNPGSQGGGEEGSAGKAAEAPGAGYMIHVLAAAIIIAASASLYIYRRHR